MLASEFTHTKDYFPYQNSPDCNLMHSLIQFKTVMKKCSHLVPHVTSSFPRALDPITKQPAEDLRSTFSCSVSGGRARHEPRGSEPPCHILQLSEKSFQTKKVSS